MEKKLKIAVWYNLPTGGARRALCDHVRGLVERGHEVQVWRPPIPSEDWLSLAEFAKETVVPLEFGDEGVGYVGKLIQHFRRQTVLIAAMEQHSRECARQISEGGFDVVFANTCRHFYAPFIGRYITNIPKVLYLQEPNRALYEAMPDLAWLGNPTGSWRRRLRAKLDVPGYRKLARTELDNAASYDQILVNSFFSRESVLRAYGLNSTVCYLGVDTDHFVPGNTARESFVLGVGAIAPSKNVLLAIEAVGAIKKNRPPLVWIGNFSDTTYRRLVESRAKELGVNLEVRTLTSDEELIRAYQTAVCVVFTPNLEPFGYVPLEAMAGGTPIIGVREGGLRETIVDGETGFLTDSDPAEIGDRIRSLLEDPSLSNKIGQRGRAWVEERWSLAGAIDRLEGALLGVLETGGK